MSMQPPGNPDRSALAQLLMNIFGGGQSMQNPIYAKQHADAGPGAIPYAGYTGGPSLPSLPPGGIPGGPGAFPPAPDLPLPQSAPVPAPAPQRAPAAPPVPTPRPTQPAKSSKRLNRGQY